MVWVLAHMVWVLAHMVLVNVHMVWVNGHMVWVLGLEHTFLVHEVFHEPLGNGHNELAPLAHMVWGYVVGAIDHVPLVHNLSLDVTDKANGHHKQVVVVPDIVVSLVVDMAELVELLEM